MTKTVGMTSKIKVCSYHHLLECLPYQTYGVLLFKYYSLLYKGRPPQRSPFSNSWTSDVLVNKFNTVINNCTGNFRIFKIATTCHGVRTKPHTDKTLQDKPPLTTGQNPTSFIM